MTAYQNKYLEILKAQKSGPEPQNLQNPLSVHL